jgi:hypothetical protein
MAALARTPALREVTLVDALSALTGPTRNAPSTSAPPRSPASRAWRKAFERWRENGTGVDRSAGRLIELRQSKSRLQTEAAPALLSLRS